MIHAYQMNGYRIVLDVHTGSIYEVDEVTFALVTRFCKVPTVQEAMQVFGDLYDEQAVEEAVAEITVLYEQQALFTNQPEHKVQSVDTPIDGLKAVCLHAAHDCDLRCAYCFAGKGDYHTGRSLMTEETAKKAIDFLAARRGRREHVEVDFFGGEPLLNEDLIVAAVQYGQTIGTQENIIFHFTITTNGYRISDRMIDIINTHMDNVVISLDGRPRHHDRMRKTASGKGSYEQVVQNAKRLIDRRGDKPYFIRGTFTRHNLDFAKDVFHIASLGFDEISVEPVVGQGEEYHIQKEHVPRICAEYEHLALEILRKDAHFRFYHFNMNLYEGACLAKRIRACGAGTEYIAVGPDERIYPCHQFVGIDKFCLGSLDEGIIRTDLQQAFAKANIFGKGECTQCWAQYFCSGGCHANAYFVNEDFTKPDPIACALQKKRIECAILLQVADGAITGKKADKVNGA